MLTRLEVDGFKNLLGLSVDLGPFTCIAGANGTGKSNVFDAIQFLGLLADQPLMEAAQQVRGVHGERLGDPRDLFWNGYAPGPHTMRFAAEMIVAPEVVDDFGRPAEPTRTFLRYVVELGYEPPSGVERIGRLALRHESLSAIPQPRVLDHLRFPHSAKFFRDATVRGRSPRTPFIGTTKGPQGDPYIGIVRDNAPAGSRIQGAPASRAPATLLSTITSSEYATILAARREMQTWWRLALEPSALRTPDSYNAPRELRPDGLHLPATLFRIAHESGGKDNADQVYSQVAGRLADLTGISVRRIEVLQDDVRQLFTLQLHEADGMVLPARSLSEGTLRFLAVCVLLEDHRVGGLLCMEEPENGIHPASLGAVVQLIRDLAVDATATPGPDNPFRQVLVNTHSPGVVQLVPPQDLLFAHSALVRTPGGTLARSLRLRPLADTWRAGPGDDYVTMADILPYLAAPAGARLTLPGEVA